MARKMLMRVEADNRGAYMRPVMLIDTMYLGKKKTQSVYTCTFSATRDRGHNSKMWSIISFVLDNLPENQPDFVGKTTEWMYTWLKLRVGYCEVYKVGDTVVNVPRATNFSDQDDEVDYLDNFHQPALRVLSEIMGYASVHELEEASRLWMALQ